MAEQPTDGLAHLIQRLDALVGSLALVDLADAMKEVQISLADVAGHIQENPRNYNRVLIVRRAHYELLVMTWLPGQSSVPHDHAGSVCAMQVMQGDAVEGSFRIAGDGFVDLEYESTVKSDQITAGQDAGIHTVRNASADQRLVTVHVYAPPLRDYRQFVARPTDAPAAVGNRAGEPPTVVVVGGGFSGSMSAAQLLRRAAEAQTPLRVVLVERRGTVGEGVAYGTRSPSHLLNVPAGKMSAWPDRPDDFRTWASARYGEVQPGDFVSRQWYGQYIRESLLTAAEQAKPWGNLSVVFDEARRVARHPAGGWMVHLGSGASVRAQVVILAVGHRAPSDPIGPTWTGARDRFIADPWKPFALNPIAPDDSVAVIGSGLTAVDTILALARHPRQAPITFISRRGLLPLPHAPANVVDMTKAITELTGDGSQVTIRELFKRIRQSVREAAKAGTDWRGVIDGLRPHTPALWRALPVTERKRFLARLRPFWEVHRHRMPAAAANQLKSMQERGELRIVAARIVAALADAQSVHLTLAPRGSDNWTDFNVRWVINCTGPMPDNSAASNPVIGSLLVDGWLMPDELRLGIQTTPDGVAIGADGSVIGDLRIVGTLRKPTAWESTAVPELRQQAALVAEKVLTYHFSRGQR